MFKITSCTPLASNTTFCQSHALQWWAPLSQADAQAITTNAYSYDPSLSWIDVYGVTTSANTIGGYAVTTNLGSCESYNGSATGWAAFREWGCSFCNPLNNGVNATYDGSSCCWDGPGDGFDYFACQD
jgi:hypothetical protein